MARIDAEAVRPCLEIGFRPGELLNHSTVVVEYTDGFNPRTRHRTALGDLGRRHPELPGEELRDTGDNGAESED